MKRRWLHIVGLAMVAMNAGCIVKNERVVYRPTPAPHQHAGSGHAGESGSTMPADPDPALDPVAAPGAMGDVAHTLPPIDKAHARGHDDDVEVEVGKGHGPPAHAPAHGLRRRQSYFYYPSYEVYYAPHRRWYFWIEGGVWVGGAECPVRFRLDAREAVALKLETEKPYEQHEAIRKKHGPKNDKKAKGGKGNKQ